MHLLVMQALSSMASMVATLGTQKDANLKEQEQNVMSLQNPDASVLSAYAAPHAGQPVWVCHSSVCYHVISRSPGMFWKKADRLW